MWAGSGQRSLAASDASLGPPHAAEHARIRNTLASTCDNLFKASRRFGDMAQNGEVQSFQAHAWLATHG